MAVNWMVQQLCKEEDVGSVDLWGKKTCTWEMACILVEKGLLFLPSD